MAAPDSIEKEFFIRAMVKILVDHLSYVSFISTFKIDWSSLVLDMLSVGDQYLQTVPSEMFNFECFDRAD